MKKILIVITVIFMISSSINIVGSYKTSNTLNEENKNQEKTRFNYEDKYSVIIVGTYGGKKQESITGKPREDYYYFYTGSAQRRFDMLTENPRYNFDPNNVYVLLTEVNKEGYLPHENYDSNKFINHYNATKENITMVFNQLSDKIDENDLLLVDLVSHGNDDNAKNIPFYTKLTGKLCDKNKGLTAHDTFIPLEKEGEEESEQNSKIKFISFFKKFLFPSYDNVTIANSKNKLYDHELASLTDNINSRRTIFILQPCHSGGFINDLSKENHVIIASCDEGEVAGDFLGPFNKGLDGKADINADDKISLAESFSYAYENIAEYYPDIYPLIDDDADKIGSDTPGIITDSIFDFSYEEI